MSGALLLLLAQPMRVIASFIIIIKEVSKMRGLLLLRQPLGCALRARSTFNLGVLPDEAQ